MLLLLNYSQPATVARQRAALNMAEMKKNCMLTFRFENASSRAIFQYVSGPILHIHFVLQMSHLLSGTLWVYGLRFQEVGRRTSSFYIIDIVYLGAVKRKTGWDLTPKRIFMAQ